LFLENQQQLCKNLQELNETTYSAAPTNVTGAVQNYDPILISLVRRALPNLIAYDVAGSANDRPNRLDLRNACSL
jgi:hypothetical protein